MKKKTTKNEVENAVVKSTTSAAKSKKSKALPVEISRGSLHSSLRSTIFSSPRPLKIDQAKTVLQEKAKDASAVTSRFIRNTVHTMQGQAKSAMTGVGQTWYDRSSSALLRLSDTSHFKSPQQGSWFSSGFNRFKLGIFGMAVILVVMGFSLNKSRDGLDDGLSADATEQTATKTASLIKSEPGKASVTPAFKSGGTSMRSNDSARFADSSVKAEMKTNKKSVKSSKIAKKSKNISKKTARAKKASKARLAH